MHPPEPVLDIAHLGHVELLTPRPEESRRFFTEVMGMTESGRQGDSVYLRGWDDYERYSLQLTAAPASGLSIWAFEPNEFGIVATFFLYNGATLLGTQDLIGLAASPGTFTGGSKFVDLSSFSNVTRMEIRGPGGSAFTDDSYGGNGIGWDNLSYTIPAPGVAGLLTLAGTAALRRRRA